MLPEIYIVAGGVGFIYIVGTSLFGFLNHDDAGGDIGDSGDGGDFGGDGGDIGGADAGDVGGVGASADFGGDAGGVDVGGHHTQVAQTGAQFRAGVVARNKGRRFSPALLVLKLISPSTITTFGFFFGLTGFMLLHYLPWTGTLSLIPALIAGYIGYTVMTRLSAAMTSRMHVTTTFRESDMIGHTAEITVPISHGRLGEVTYTANGVRTTAPARAVQGESAYKTSAKVIITDIKDGIIYVEDCPEELTSL